MAFSLVQARPIPERLAMLRQRLDTQAFHTLRPFGHALTDALEQARSDPGTGWATWEEADDCTPPLAMEHAAVLNQYVTDLTVQPVQQGEGCERLPTCHHAGRREMSPLLISIEGDRSTRVA